MNSAPQKWNSCSPPILPNLSTKRPSVFRIQRFFQLKYWSREDCIMLLCWHIVHERHYRRGWNNNLSLTNCDLPSHPGEMTWSLMLYKLEYFDVSYALIMPFKFETDCRDLTRAYTTFALIRDNAYVYCHKTDRVLIGTDRAPVIDGLVRRIYVGFDWKPTAKTKEYPIRRYRLLSVLNSPDLFLTAKEDVHHLDGIDKILSGDTRTINDTVRNLQVLTRTNHSLKHVEALDLNWTEM